MKLTFPSEIIREGEEWREKWFWNFKLQIVMGSNLDRIPRVDWRAIRPFQPDLEIFLEQTRSEAACTRSKP